MQLGHLKTVTGSFAKGVLMVSARELRHADLDALPKGVCRGCRETIKRGGRLWCWVCGDLKNYFAGKVSGAVKAGILPKLDGSIKCHCCAAPAKEYDHRDYDKPLEVIPMCRSCNGLAGPGRLSLETIVMNRPKGKKRKCK